MPLPSIGVVTPSYNQAQFIRNTIDSILNQEYKNMEYWVIDGGSSDDTVAILKSYGSRVQWISERDNGQTEAINKGLKRLNTDIVCYINSDDLVSDGAFTRVANEFIRGADWVVGSYEIIDEHGEQIHLQSCIPKYKNFLLRHYSPFVLRATNSIIPQPSTYWSARAMKQTGYLNESLRYTMDYEYWLRLSKNFAPKIIPDVLSQFRLHAASKSGSQYTSQFAEELRVLREHGCSTIEYILHRVHTNIALAAYGVLK